MSRSPEELLAQIDEATGRLLGTVRGLTDDDVRRPSLLPGWTRGHVLAHLTGGADAIRSVMDGARAGTPATGYASQEARDRAIEDGAGRDASTLAVDVAAAADRLQETAASMPPEVWARSVGILTGATFPAVQLLERRLVELVLHHTDLDAGYTVQDWSASFTEVELDEPMRSQRADRISWGGGLPPDKLT